MITVGLVAVLLLGTLMFNLFSRPPASLGPHEGRLAACPSSPNCVCSQSPDDDDQHAIEALRFSGEANAAWLKLVQVVGSRPRATIVTQRDNYLHAEFESKLLRFVDDVEFLLDAEHGCIHVRSASRIGRSDLGVNRRRVEEIRAAFQTTSP